MQTLLILWLILFLLIGLSVLIVILIIGSRKQELPAHFDAAIKEQFLAFQSNIHKELNMTREEVGRSKDLLSENTIKTIDTIKNMGDTIHKIVQQQEEAQRLGQSLKDLLQAPKLRGNYGEAVLEELLSRALPDNIWEKQYQIDEGLKVDAAVKIKDIVIPIDAKFPRDDYLKYLAAESADEKRIHWKNHETAVRSQIRSISSKYIKPEKGTSDFALMFIPSESTYYEMISESNSLEEKTDLYDYAQDNKIIPVSPNTLYAFLQVIIIGIHNMDIIKNARQLQEGLAKVQKSFEMFYGKYEEIGKYLEKASEAYRIGDKHIENYKKKLDSALNYEQFGPADKITPEVNEHKEENLI